MGASLLRDAVRRLGAGVALALVPVGWLWRSFPPPAVRAWLWSFDGEGTVVAVIVLPLGWAIVTAPLVRLLLRSARLEYWRQFPIARSQWLLLHARNLACIDVPALGLAIYLFAPLGDVETIAAASIAVVLFAMAAQVGIAIAPLPRMVASPRARTRVGALLRLYLLAVVRRDRAPLWLALAVQLGAIAYAFIGVANVVHDEREAAWSLFGGAAVLGSLAAAWLVLRAQRAVDRDRWYLDALTAPELHARVLVGIAFASPLIVGLVVAAQPLGGLALVRAGLTALVVSTWAASGFVRIGARAEARRMLEAPQHTRGLVLGVYGLVAVIVLDPLALAVAAVLELAVARRALARAAEARTRFETTNREDDHE